MSGPVHPDRRPHSSRPREQVKTMIGFVRELWQFLRVRKKFWLLPILMMLVLLGGLIILTQGSAVAPFIYTIF